MREWCGQHITFSGTVGRRMGALCGWVSGVVGREGGGHLLREWAREGAIDGSRAKRAP